jgi:hypothetical protein
MSTAGNYPVLHDCPQVRVCLYYRFSRSSNGDWRLFVMEKHQGQGSDDRRVMGLSVHQRQEMWYGKAVLSYCTGFSENYIGIGAA